jgi:Putative Actinobacterial Holin-X, holin superfamily III
MATEPERESMIGLARSVVRGFVQLARLEATRARQEIGQMVSESLSGVIRIAIAVGLVILALVALVVFLILGLAALTGLPGWLSALLVAVVLTFFAVILAWLGIRRIRVGPPEETIASVKEDVAWAKRLLRRD